MTSALLWLSRISDPESSQAVRHRKTNATHLNYFENSIFIVVASGTLKLDIFLGKNFAIIEL